MTAATPNTSPYDTLGIDPDATDDVIKDAYRKMARSTHPDKGGSADAFHVIHQAYVLLSNPMARDEYDRTGNVNYQDSTSYAYRVEQLAYSVLGISFAQLVSDPASLDQLDDIFDELAEGLEQRIENLGRQKIETARSLQHYKTLKKRIKYKNNSGKGSGSKAAGTDILGGILDQRVRELSNSLKHTDMEIEAAQFAVGLLENYSVEGGGDGDIATALQAANKRFRVRGDQSREGWYHTGSWDIDTAA